MQMKYSAVALPGASRAIGFEAGGGAVIGTLPQGLPAPFLPGWPGWEVLGALVLHVLADLTRNLFGELPGINMVIYGSVLVLIVMFFPRGIASIGQSVTRLWKGAGRG